MLTVHDGSETVSSTAACAALHLDDSIFFKARWQRALTIPQKSGRPLSSLAHEPLSKRRRVGSAEWDALVDAVTLGAPTVKNEDVFASDVMNPPASSSLQQQDEKDPATLKLRMY